MLTLRNLQVYIKLPLHWSKNCTIMPADVWDYNRLLASAICYLWSWVITAVWMTCSTVFIIKTKNFQNVLWNIKICCYSSISKIYWAAWVNPTAVIVLSTDWTHAVLKFPVTFVHEIRSKGRAGQVRPVTNRSPRQTRHYTGEREGKINGEEQLS